jgi:hypothetical protein
MHPNKVNRNQLQQLTDLPNIGKASMADLHLLGIYQADQLVGKNPFDMYQELCLKTAIRHDPCVIDVFMSITRFIAGEDAQPWWAYTAERKRILAAHGAP